MSFMFRACGCATLDLRGLNTSKVTNMYEMFSGWWFSTRDAYVSWSNSYTPKLESVNLSGLDTSNVTKMECMFYSAKNLKTITVSNTFVVGENTSGGDMFQNCNLLKGGNGTGYNWKWTDKTYARIDGGPNSDTPGYFTAATGTQSLTNSVNINDDSAYGFGVDPAA